jgi:hypothetical protein
MSQIFSTLSINVSSEYIEKIGNINTKILHKTIKNNSEKNGSKYGSKETDTEIQYYILNYDEALICEDDINRGKYRSIITTYPEKDILSISIPKNVSLEYFKFHYTNSKIHSIYVNELIEGTMIHLFYDKRISSWEIATKRSIGGDYYYQQQNKLDDEHITFLNMVMDAFQEDRNKTINEISFLSKFPKQFSYQFVLQHPKNHIVFPIKTPKMYLVGVYEICELNIIRYVSPLDYENWSVLKNKRIYFPEEYDIEKMITEDGEICYESVQDEYVSIQTPILSRMGIMIANVGSGEHCLVMNPTYEEYKRIRGNYPDNQFLYLHLLKLGIVMEFLQFFPQYRKLFFRFRDEYETLIKNIHQSYLSYFILKKGVIIQKKYMTHIYALHHNIYLPSLSTQEKQIITKKRVKEYMSSLEPGQILHTLNYDKRELSKDCIAECTINR